MTILIVDDQQTVIDGILSHIQFQNIGIDHVKTANRADAAIQIIAAEPVDILLTDIEMPGKSGLELVADIQMQDEKPLCILLTSHAQFAYAQKGINLGCFGYILQPAPYEEIEECLKRAVSTIRAARADAGQQSYSNLFKSHELELINTSTQRLFSRNPRDVQDAKALLNEYGYHIDDDCFCQLLFLNSFTDANRSASAPSQNAMISLLSDALNGHKPDASLQTLISAQHRRNFSILFLSEAKDNLPLPIPYFEKLYSAIRESLQPHPLAGYITGRFPLDELYSITSNVQTMMKENVAQQSDLFFYDKLDGYREIPASLSAYVARWEKLLLSDKRFLLRREVRSYISDKILNTANQYQKLCDLHRALIQMFFGFFHEMGIELSSIFTDDYTYQDCMACFETVSSLEHMVDYLLDAASGPAGKGNTGNYVDRAKIFIMDNLSLPVSVKDVADHVHLNPEYFTRYFKKETGIGIKEYITEVKISAAKDFLVNTNLSVSVIALELGYSNYSYFTQLFRQYEQVTPLEYRKLNKPGE